MAWAIFSIKFSRMFKQIYFILPSTGLFHKGKGNIELVIPTMKSFDSAKQLITCLTLRTHISTLLNQGLNQEGSLLFQIT